MMKDFMKKILVTICAVSASAMLITASVYATDAVRPMPGDNTDQSYTTSAGDPAVTDNADTGADTSVNTVNNVAANNTSANTASNTSNKKYQTRLGGFLWFLLSVIVNFVLSCWIGNRFYKLAKRNAQGSSEIRALRKDIEEKFASTLRDISEPAVEVINQNESYARSEEGLSMPERRSRVELSDEEREMMRKWDAKRVSERAAADAEDIDEDYYDDEPQQRSYGRSYQPTRRSSGIDFEDEDEEYDDIYEDDDEADEYEDRRYQNSRRPGSRDAVRKTTKKASGKAKKFLNNVFPFDE